MADSVIRSLLGTSVGPAFTVYDDSDGLRISASRSKGRYRAAQ